MSKQVLPDKHIQVNCPDCSSPMVLRNGRYGAFYGCSKYPKCKGTRSVKSVKRMLELSQSKPKRQFTPSHFQQAIFDKIEQGTGHIVVGADAGSGKTTTAVQALKLTPKDAKVLYCTFSKDMADELAAKVPPHVSAGTLHSIGLRALSNYLPGRPELDTSKVWNICKELLPTHKDQSLRAPLKKMVSLAKATLVDPTDREAVDAMASRYEIELNGDADRLIELLPVALQMCKERTYIIDFDDMIWMPVVFDINIGKYDYVFIDECQDLNACQIQLALKLTNGDGRIVAVGDAKQSIYGFRGADTEAMPRLKAALEADELPLSISYRNPTSHLDLVRQHFPHITTEPAPWAKEGEIEHLSEYAFNQQVQEEDLVLCRVNAPLVKTCYSFIRQGRKAVIRGRNIGQMLNNMIDRLLRDTPPERQTITALLTELRLYKHREAARLKAADKEEKIASLYDRCDTLEALCDGMRDLSDLRHHIRKIFDDVTRKAIILSSVHRAKGTEAERVYILRPDLMPHPLATQPWQQVQEDNILYVALTRSKDYLGFVDS